MQDFVLTLTLKNFFKKTQGALVCFRVNDISVLQDKSQTPRLGQMFEAILKCILKASEGQWDTVLLFFQC